MASAVRTTMLGAGIGAGVMFLLDPGRGARRRALVRDKITRAVHRTRDVYDATLRDVRNRAAGAAAEIGARVPDEVVDDRRLAERVRAKLGRVASHPRAIQVAADHGRVTLSGDALAAEVHDIVAAIRGVRGVDGVENRLNAHAAAGAIPSLQGSSARPGLWVWWPGRWSPTARLLAGLGAAASLAAVATRRR
jgi:hypothetical protein